MSKGKEKKVALLPELRKLEVGQKYEVPRPQYTSMLTAISRLRIQEYKMFATKLGETNVEVTRTA
jgi:hypothetical protein